jgi:hypothetical protein
MLLAAGVQSTISEREAQGYVMKLRLHDYDIHYVSVTCAPQQQQRCT